MQLRERLVQCNLAVPAGTLAPSFREVAEAEALRKRNRRITRRLARRGHDAAVLHLRHDIDMIPLNSALARKGWS